MERILEVRRDAKRKVFVRNAIRALRQVAPEHDLRSIPNVVLVGGSAEDFEIPEMLMQHFLNTVLYADAETSAEQKGREMQLQRACFCLISEVPRRDKRGCK